MSVVSSGAALSELKAVTRPKTREGLNFPIIEIEISPPPPKKTRWVYSPYMQRETSFPKVLQLIIFNVQWHPSQIRLDFFVPMSYAKMEQIRLIRPRPRCMSLPPKNWI